jgi:hypothetical protein
MADPLADAGCLFHCYSPVKRDESMGKRRENGSDLGRALTLNICIEYHEWHHANPVGPHDSAQSVDLAPLGTPTHTER